MSFIKFMTSRTGFGKTPWPTFGLIQLMCLCLVMAGIETWANNGWVPIAMSGAIEAVLLYGTWKNYKKDWV